jgi:hypothetical protein
MKHNKRCKIGIGDICLSISSDDHEFIDYFKLYYHHCLIDASPDFSVNINLQKNITRQDIRKSLDDYRKYQRQLSEGDFSLYDNMMFGSIHKEDKTCELFVEKALVASDYLPLFQDLIFKDLFYFINRNAQSNGYRHAYLIHGCGIHYEDAGLLFLGPSGSGKSTVAKLSKNHTVLHDEVVLLNEKNGSYYIESTPYLSGIEYLKNSRAKLEVGFFLKHGKINHIQKQPTSKMVTQFIQQIVAPSSFYSKSKEAPLKEMLNFTCDVVEKIPFFELHFSHKDDSFWQVIQKTL